MTLWARRTVAPALTLVGAMLLAGCTGQMAGGPAEPTTRTSSTTTPSPVAAGTQLDEESGGGTVDPKPAPAWNDAQRRAAAEAAAKSVAAFARPGLAADEWWKQLAPLLTEQAQSDYQYVDPANVPARKVTGPGKVTDESARLAARVEVRTDAGTYTVVLIRQDGASPWLAARFIPPEGTH